MYPVTKQYKEAMRAPIREVNAHATVYFGMFDQAAAGDATLGWTDSTEYAHPSNINSRENIHVSYATFEPNQLRLDGAQALLPSNSALWLAGGQRWLFSEYEVFSAVTSSVAGEKPTDKSICYPAFTDTASRVKNVGASASHWWERSPFAINSTYFCRVTSGGTANSAAASYTYGVAVGFCV